MKYSLLVAAVLAIALSACAKKEEPSQLPPPATPPSLSSTAPAVPAEPGKPLEAPAPAAEPAAPGVSKPAS